MHKTPQLRYGDGYSLGQLARSWQKPSVFMKSLSARDYCAPTSAAWWPMKSSVASTRNPARHWTELVLGS